MKAKGFLLMTTLLISGCAQVNDQFYSKKNFTSESFRADASECKSELRSRHAAMLVVIGKLSTINVPRRGWPMSDSGPSRPIFL